MISSSGIRKKTRLARVARGAFSSYYLILTTKFTQPRQVALKKVPSRQG
nr:MAG TPA: hypothetical protein [Inoviridae sp.]